MMAFLKFEEEKVDFAVLECGLGGRLDATNVCKPIVTAITSIGLDHCNVLGNTIDAIALEKAGIIKPGAPVIVGPDTPVELLGKIASDRGSHFIHIDATPGSSFVEDNCAVARQVLQTLRESEIAPLLTESNI